MSNTYVEDYFIEYKDYYEKLKFSASSSYIAENYMEKAQSSIQQFESLKEFVATSNWQGESKKAINETLDLLNYQYETLKYNIENSLVPTSVEIDFLIENLTLLKETNLTYKMYLEELDIIRTNPPSKTISNEDEMGKVTYVTNPEYIEWEIKVKKIETSIQNLIIQINGISETCNLCLEKIKKLEALIKPFSSVKFLAQKSNYYETGSSSSFYWRVGDVVYQLVAPLCKVGEDEFGRAMYKNIVLDEDYLIVYDLNAIREKLGEKNSSYYESFEKTLNLRLEGEHSYWYNYEEQNIGKPSTINAIKIVMNQVLNDTYQANSDVSRSVISSFIMTNSPVKFKYEQVGSSAYTEGYSDLAKYGKLDCIAIVRWSEYQDILAMDQSGNHQMNNDILPVNPKNILVQYSYDPSVIPSEELAQVPAGSVLTTPFVDSKGRDNYHVARVIGHTTVDGEPAIVVSQASGHGAGLINSVYKVSEISEKWHGVTSPEMMRDFALNGESARPVADRYVFSDSWL